MRSDCYFDECKDCVYREYNNSLVCCLTNRLSLAFYKLFAEIPIVNKFIDNYKHCYSFIEDKE